MKPMTVGAAKPMTVGAAAKYLGVSKDTVRQWTNNGKLPESRTPEGHRVFFKEDVERVRDAQCVTTSVEARFLTIEQLVEWFRSSLKRLEEMNLPMNKKVEIKFWSRQGFPDAMCSLGHSDMPLGLISLPTLPCDMQMWANSIMDSNNSFDE
jgi:excisionase family DNA binding protein